MNNTPKTGILQYKSTKNTLQSQLQNLTQQSYCIELGKEKAVLLLH